MSQDNKQSFFITAHGILTGCAAVITAVASLIGACYAAGLLRPTNLSLLTTQTQPPTLTAVVAEPLPTLIPETEKLTQLPTPLPNTNSDFNIPILDSNCPFDPRAGWLYYPHSWYGPWSGYYILYDLNYFYVFDPYQWDQYTGSYGVQIPYSNQFAHNSWIELIYSPFWACIDNSGNAYVVYTGP